MAQTGSRTWWHPGTADFWGIMHIRGFHKGTNKMCSNQLVAEAPRRESSWAAKEKPCNRKVYAAGEGEKKEKSLLTVRPHPIRDNVDCLRKDWVELAQDKGCGYCIQQALMQGYLMPAKALVLPPHADSKYEAIGFNICLLGLSYISLKLLAILFLSFGMAMLTLWNCILEICGFLKFIL